MPSVCSLINFSLLKRSNAIKCQLRTATWYNHPGNKQSKKRRMETHPYMFHECPETKDGGQLVRNYPPVKPLYPPTLDDWGDMSPETAWLYQDQVDWFKHFVTIPERMAILACPRNRSFIEHITNTHLIERSSEQLWSDEVSVSDEDIEHVRKLIEVYVKDFQPEPLDSNQYEPDILREERENESKEKRVSAFINELMRFLVTWWKRSGFESVNIRGKAHLDDRVIEFQFKQSSLSQIKSSNAPLVQWSVEECQRWSNPPPASYHPSSYKIFADHTIHQQIPGNWYDDSLESRHQLLTVYSSIGMDSGRRKTWWLNDASDPDGQFRFQSRQNWAMLAGNAELTAQAYHLGYSMWTDVDRPFVGRLALTDGLQWTFAIYQLNSLQLFRSNARPNGCWLDPQVYSLWSIDENHEIVVNKQCVDRIVSAIQQPTERLTIPADLYCRLSDLTNDRHRSLCRQMYELCRHTTEQSMHDDRKLKKSTGRSNFAKFYGQVMFRYADIVREKYPRDVYGYELELIARNPRRPLPSKYDIVLPDKKPSNFYFY
ncbi:hypothetical protein ACOME3_000733 [Neoechinorhynchus agilis]